MATNDPLQEQNHELGEDANSDEYNKIEKQQDEKEEKATNGGEEEDEDLEEGELKDDDDDDDEDDDDEDVDNRNNDAGIASETTTRLSGYSNNNNNNDNNNNSGYAKESPYSDSRHDSNQHHIDQSYLPHHLQSSQQPSHIYQQQQQHHHHHHSNRRLSPNSQHQAELQSQYPPNHHHFSSSSNNNHYRYLPNDGPQPPLNHHPQGGPAPIYLRGGPGNVGPMHKVNIKCRFYSKDDNKCTWGDHCRFEHRDESPGPEFDNRPPAGLGPGSSRGPPLPMGAAERGQYPPYTGRHQPYPPPPPHGYPYEAYGHHHSTPPPLPPQSMSHWRAQHSPAYPSPSSAHPPDSVSPALLPTPPSSASVAVGGSRGPPAPGGSSGGSGLSGGGAPATSGGAPSPGYPSPSSSAVVYERKHRLAYELAPWNERGYPPSNKYDRGNPAGYPPVSRGYYRNHYSREPPYGREPPPHVGGQYPGYPAYPSAYRGGPMGPHASHFKFMSSSQRIVPPDTRRSRSTKRGHDEDESSWSDSGSEDSILGQANYSNKCHATKISKQQHQQTSDNPTSDEPLEQGSGTPPGEPLPEDRERQEMLLNKLKEIEDLMAKKKGEQEDPL